MSSKSFNVEDKLRGNMRGGSKGDIDATRHANVAYEYLCHLEEAKKWLEACLKDELPSASEMEGALQNGVLFAKLAMFFAPDVVKEKHVYDFDGKVMQTKGLVFRHTDNISQFTKGMRHVKFPEIFYPEVTDIYDKKNMPRVIYCLHALSRYLYHLGIAPEMEDLQGIAQFTEEEISAMDAALQTAGIQMPKFGKIGGLLSKELGADEASMHAAILAINQAIETKASDEELVKALKSPAAGISSVDKSLVERYRTPLFLAKETKASNAPPRAEGEAADVYDTNLTKAELQKTLNVTNAEVAAERKAKAISEALSGVNTALDGDDGDATLKALGSSVLELNDVEPANAGKYHAALKRLKSKLGRDLTQAELQDGVDDVNAGKSALQDILEALQGSDAARTFQVLRSGSGLLGLDGLNEAHATDYHNALKGVPADQLSAEKIQAIINHVNAVHAAVEQLNKAIDEGNADATLACLKEPRLGLKDVDEAGAFQYQTQLSEAKTLLAAPLSLVQVQEQINLANQAAEDNARHAAAIFAINEAVQGGDSAKTMQTLQDKPASIEDVRPSCQDRYQLGLGAALKAKVQASGGVNVWKKFKTDDGQPYYYNKKTKETQWVPPADLHLLHPEIQEVIAKCNAAHERADMFKSNESSIIKLQALTRGLLVRQKFQARLKYLRDNEDSAIKLQSAYRGFKQRKKFKDRLDYLNGHEAEAIKIQSLYKGWKARQQYKNLTKVTNPPVVTVRKFLHLLDQSDTDFREEMAVNDFRQKVIQAIKKNNKLEHDVDEMDVKIGLLVKNRIELQDVAKISKQMKRRRAKGLEITATGSQANVDAHGALSGLKSLTRTARETLESYQHLMYMMQTHPEYLARLVFIEQPLERWSGVKSAKFLQHVIQTIYNYASNARETFLLLRLYRHALALEVTEKVTQLKEIITGNPTVIKLVINHHRSSSEAGSYLADTLGPLVLKLLDKGEDLELSTDPVEIYKKWVSRTETETGQRSELPYEVDRTEAMKHQPVIDTINKNVTTLLDLCRQYQDAIVGGLPKLPYGLRYICMAARQDLSAKFPNVPDDDVTKVIGNILFSRYMNPAIIAPESFDVIQISPSQLITPVQRRNLASIAKVLQFAAAGQQFESNEGHLKQLNAFLGDAWHKFKAYFSEAAEVEGPEAHFNIDEYTDAKSVSKPIIYISPSELYHLHEMLNHNVDELAADAKDPLREILNDLGPVGEEEEVLGEEGSPQHQQSKQEMSLTLTNKFEVPGGEDHSTKALLVRTKRLIIDVIRFQQGKNLLEILDTPADLVEEAEYTKYLEQLKAKEAERKKEGDVSPMEQPARTLAEAKKIIREKAELLEKEGICSKDNGYQALLNAVAKDIRNQRIYRRQRKNELVKLQTAVTDLGKKENYYTEQLESYDVYVNACMEQMAKGKTKKSRFGMFKTKDKDTSGGQSHGSYKYSAAKLKEKGVLVSVDGIGDGQLKLVNLELSSKETGVFKMKASLFGMKKEEEVLLQDLLQMQYDGVATMKMMDNCTVNVNLLIFLINKKFYNK